MLAVVSSPAHQHAPQECTAVPGPSLGTIPNTPGPSSTVHCRPPWQCSATELWLALTLYQAFLRQGLPGSYACGPRALPGLPSPKPTWELRLWYAIAFYALRQLWQPGPPCPDCTIHTPLPGDPTPGRTRAHSPSEGYNFEGWGKMSRGAPCPVTLGPNTQWGRCPGANSPGGGGSMFFGSRTGEPRYSGCHSGSQGKQQSVLRCSYNLVSCCSILLQNYIGARMLGTACPLRAAQRKSAAGWCSVMEGNGDQQSRASRQLKHAGGHFPSLRSAAANQASRGPGHVDACRRLQSDTDCETLMRWAVMFIPQAAGGAAASCRFVFGCARG